jgi:predicted metalloprotease with PDZ domain
MVRLWHEFAEPGRGVGEQDIQALCEAVLGESLAEFFQAALHGTGELPFAPLLGGQGVDVLVRPAESAADNGGKAVPFDQARKRPALGAKIVPGEGGALLAHVFTAGPAMQAGLSAGDIVIAVNGLRVNAITAEKVISSHAVGETITLHAFRRDELMQFEVALAQAPADTCVLTLAAEVDTARRAESWILGR